jgi:hypothetical protein
VLLYFAVRGLTQGDEVAAVQHGLDVLAFANRLGLDIEAGLQDRILGDRIVLTAINWSYIWGHWPVVIATLVWLHRTNRLQFVLLRNTMFISGAVGLIIFALHPVAPPRLLNAGLTDTVTAFSNSYRVLQPPSLVNKYAALPSLHVGWNLLIGIFVWRNAEATPLRLFGALSSAFVAAAVVLTANHYFIDGLAGAAIALTGLHVAPKIPDIFCHRPTLRASQQATPINLRSAPIDPGRLCDPDRFQLDRTEQGLLLVGRDV